MTCADAAAARMRSAFAGGGRRVRSRSRSWHWRSVLPVGRAVTAPDTTTSPQTTIAAAGTPALAAWRNLYDWPAGHGHFGWNEFSSAPDPADYGFARGTADGPGLWVWPTGDDRTYTPPTVAEWRYPAPGTTRARSVAVELDYAPRLL